MSARWWGSLSEAAHEAVSNLVSQYRRSGLALLGIVIGAASIIAMVNVGHMAQRESMRLFSRMGIDMLQLSATPTGQETAGMSRAAIEGLPQEQPGVALAVPLAVGRRPVLAGAVATQLGVVGAPTDLAALAGLRAAAGRLLGSVDACGQAAVLGHGAAGKLSSPGHAVGPGARIDVGDYGFRVVGVLAPAIVDTLSPADYNDAVFLPLDCVRRVLPGAEPTAALIRLIPGADAATVGAAVQARLQRDGTQIQVSDARAMVATMVEQQQVHARVLAASGAIALLVGGIGVMNVMLMGMIERRREIGLRLALGAVPRDVQLMFVVEAGLLTALGGALGVVVGLAVAWVMARGSGWEFAVAGWTIVAGPAVAAAMGLLFGAYPAVSASRLDPIEALRET